MSDPWPDALFGVDGTELPVPDRSGRDRQRDTSVFSSLGSLPHLGMTAEQIAATAGESLDEPAAQAPAAQATVPASPPMAPPAPQPGVTPAPVDTTAPQPVAPTRAPAPDRPTEPIIAPSGSSGGDDWPDPSPSRGLGALRYRWRVSPKIRPHGRRRDSRRAGPGSGALTRTWANGGAGAFFTVMIITFAVLLYFIVSGIVAAFARLIP